MTCLFFVPSIDEPKARAMLAAMEAILETGPLAYRVEPNGRFHAVDDPAAWLVDRLAGHTSALICNGDEDEYASLMAVAIPPALVSGGERLIQMVVNFPDTPAYVERMPDLFAAFGPAAGAYWGIDMLGKASLAIADGAGRTPPDPMPLQPTSPSAAIPGRLAWTCYWSDEACRLLGFSPKNESDDEGDDARASLFARVTRVAGHGVVLQLTSDMLDLDRPAHLAVLTAIYDAFPPMAQKWGF